MMNNEKLFSLLRDSAISLGATHAEIIGTELVPLDPVFRSMCESNACGTYGRCWMCPPDVGDIEELMAQVREYDYAFVYQLVSELEDSFDFEGMIDARKNMSKLTQTIAREFADIVPAHHLHLSVGGCGVCEVCAKVEGKPCLHPDLAVPSLEAYGVNVSRLAAAAGMKYINGQDTVTYFGALLFSADSTEE